MNYELAKELKDAGFPQGHSGMYPPDQKEHDLHALAYVPTLEELIEACGNDFFKLIKQEHDSWYAGDETNKIYAYGETPTIAVTRLWLALHNTPNENKEV